MAEKKLNEAEMRKYIENEVRSALLAENINEELNENMTDEGILRWINGLLGNQQGGRGVSMEGIIGAILGHVAIAPILTKLLNAIGIPADGPLGHFIIKRAGEVGGYFIGDWIDKKKDPIGIDNLLGSFQQGQTQQQQGN